MKIKIQNLKRKMNRRAAALSLAVLMGFSALAPNITNAFDLTMVGYRPGDPLNKDSWMNETVLAKAVEGFSKNLFIGDKQIFSTPITGMAFTYASFLAPKTRWPLGGFESLQQMDENAEFSMFENRHTYCSGNHESAVVINPGTRALIV